MKKLLKFYVVLMILFSGSTFAQTSGSISGKYDFIPGEKTIFFDDFSQEPVGEFPAKWNTNTGGSVVTLNNAKWFKIQAQGGNYFPEINLKFPENVTIEFDVILTDNSEFNLTYYSEETFDINAYGVPGESGAETNFSWTAQQFRSYSTDEANQGKEVESSNDNISLTPNKPAHIAVWIQKSRYRAYIGTEKIFDIPKGVFTNHIYNRLRFETSNAAADILIGNVRIAVGAPDTRNQLITEGKFSTNGILFDVNSDKIKPESHACIKDIAAVLTENPSVKVLIIGHTDSDGDEAKNMDLSKRRAESVKNYLVKEFGIEVSRIQTDGKGESQPVANNNTSEGKSQNRRVEFIKQ